MLHFNSRRLSLELDNNYRRIGRFSLLIQRHPDEYRPVGKLFEVYGPGSQYVSGDHCWLIFGFGYRITFESNAVNEWALA